MCGRTLPLHSRHPLQAPTCTRSSAPISCMRDRSRAWRSCDRSNAKIMCPAPGSRDVVPVPFAKCEHQGHEEGGGRSVHQGTAPRRHNPSNSAAACDVLFPGAAHASNKTNGRRPSTMSSCSHLLATRVMSANGCYTRCVGGTHRHSYRQTGGYGRGSSSTSPATLLPRLNKTAKAFECRIESQWATAVHDAPLTSACACRSVPARHCSKDGTWSSRRQRAFSCARLQV